MLFGGIPLVLGFETADQKSDFLKSLFEETYISDITGRNNIRNKAKLEELLNILSSAIGSLTNPSKLSATFKSVKNKTISKETIIKYIDYLKDSFLIDSAIRYDIKGFHDALNAELAVRGADVELTARRVDKMNESMMLSQ